jgi:DNA polymerase I - 3''-5'' exonuclease and polymerase domains
MKKRCLVDLESSALLSQMLDYRTLPYKLRKDAKLWCVVVTDLETKESNVAVGNQITKQWMQDALKDYDFIILHNGHKFDLIVLWLFGVLEYSIGYLNESDTCFGREVQFVDTLILSRIANPDRFGGHSLHAWGVRLGNYKTDFRQQCIETGVIEKGSPKASEFLQYTPLMTEYCIQDTLVTGDTYEELVKELSGWDGWKQAIKLEHKLADLSVRRETFGFWFDKESALKCLEDLTVKMQELTDKVNPLLPEIPLSKGKLDDYTPPKNQFKADGTPTVHMVRFVQRLGAKVEDNQLFYEGNWYTLPLTEPLKTTAKATIDDMDAVKMHLIDLGWEPTEWKERDLTKDSKKQNLSIEKRVKALDRWYSETMAGKYKKARLAIVGDKDTYNKLRRRLNENKPVRVPTSPAVRVGVEKELCPHLLELGDKVAFARDFADYLTYRHRKSSIAGGDIEEMDFDEDIPNTGFLSMYREEDGRIPTPAIEIGAATNRYRHIGVANIPRASSTYGKEMRSLFGCGEGYVQLGFDFSSLENRVQGSYVFNGTDGQLLAKQLIADKPDDLHTINGQKLGISRTDAKSFTYAILYGASAKKVSKMLSCTMERAEQLVTEFWEAVPALNELKQQKEQEWLQTGKKYIRGVDGRKINIRSQHSILNALFQSGGVICTKYTTVFLLEQLEKQGYCIDCFKGVPDVAEMISYHDESQLAVRQALTQFIPFETEGEGKEFISSVSLDYQLSALSEGKSWYITLPNVVSQAIEDSIKKTGELVGLNVPLGYEWIVNKTWYGCH